MPRLIGQMDGLSRSCLFVVAAVATAAAVLPLTRACVDGSFSLDVVFNDGDGNYPDDADCVWSPDGSISASVSHKITFTVYSFENDYDWVRVIDENTGEYYLFGDAGFPEPGELPYVMCTNDGNFKFSLESDGSVNLEGFEAQVSLLNDDTSVCANRRDEEGNFLTSGGGGFQWQWWYWLILVYGGIPTVIISCVFCCVCCNSDGSKDKKKQAEERKKKREEEVATKKRQLEERMRQLKAKTAKTANPTRKQRAQAKQNKKEADEEDDESSDESDFGIALDGVGNFESSSTPAQVRSTQGFVLERRHSVLDDMLANMHNALKLPATSHEAAASSPRSPSLPVESGADLGTFSGYSYNTDSVVSSPNGNTFSPSAEFVPDAEEHGENGQGAGQDGAFGGSGGFSLEFSSPPPSYGSSFAGDGGDSGESSYGYGDNSGSGYGDAFGAPTGAAPVESSYGYGYGYGAEEGDLGTSSVTWPSFEDGDDQKDKPETSFGYSFE